MTLRFTIIIIKFIDCQIEIHLIFSILSLKVAATHLIYCMQWIILIFNFQAQKFEFEEN
jgi:hypothetical protein